MIKPNDYVERVEEMLNANFVDENEEEKRNKGPTAGMYVDQHYNHIQSYLKQAGQLLARHPRALRDLEDENKTGPQPENAILVTADVVGLNTNIPQDQGMQVFRDALNSSRFRPEQKLPTDFLMNLLMFVLTCNLFIFESSFWLQI